MDKEVIGKGTFRGYSVVILRPKINKNDVLLEFEEHPDGVGCWPGLMADSDDPEGLDPTKYYSYRPKDDPDLQLSFSAPKKKKSGYHCVCCNDYNQYAEANLTKDRFICHSCRSTEGWRFDGEFL